MKKIAIFIRNTETNSVSLTVKEENVEYAKERYGSMQKYLEYIYSACKNTRVEKFEYIDNLNINL